MHAGDKGKCISLLYKISMKKILLILFLLPIATNAQTGWQWAKNIVSNGTSYGEAVTTDKFGDIYITGGCSDSVVTFDAISLSNVNVYLAKYDTAGNVLWVKGATGSAFPTSVATDAEGNVYIAGAFQKPTLSFGSTILFNPDTVTSGEYIFLAKYDSSGDLIWAKSVGTFDNAINIAYSATTDAAGNIYIAGEMGSGTLTFGATTLTRIGSSAYNVFLAKYAPSGNVIWAKNAGGTGGSGAEGTSVHVDAFGHLFLGGSFETLNISFGTVTLTNTSSSGLNKNSFLVRYDTAGNAIWARSEESGNWSGTPWLITSDAADNIYFAGIYSLSAVTIGSTTLSYFGQTDIDIVKYDSSGVVIWAKGAGGTGGDAPRGIACDALGYIYVTGVYNSSSISFGTSTITNTGDNDMFFVKYDPCGNVVYATSLGSTASDIGNSVWANGSDIYLAGQFSHPSITFGTTVLTYSVTVPSYASDMLLSKWRLVANDSSCGLLRTQNIVANGIGEINLWPNPARDKLTITASNSITNVSITNLIGQILYTHEYNDQQVQVNVAELPMGVYIIRMNGSEVRKFVKK